MLLLKSPHLKFLQHLCAQGWEAGMKPHRRAWEKQFWCCEKNADGSEGTAFIKEILTQEQCVLPTEIISFSSVGCLAKKGKGKLDLASL